MGVIYIEKTPWDPLEKLVIYKNRYVTVSSFIKHIRAYSAVNSVKKRIAEHQEKIDKHNYIKIETLCELIDEFRFFGEMNDEYNMSAIIQLQELIKKEIIEKKSSCCV